MNSGEIVRILIDSYAGHKSNQEIAEERNCHRNTICLYVNRFKEQKEEILALAGSYPAKPDVSFDDPEIIRFIEKYICVRKDRKCTVDTYKVIDELCCIHLNYCIAGRSISEFAVKMWNMFSEKLSQRFGFEQELVKDHILNYCDYGFSYSDYGSFGFASREDCKTYMRQIGYIRRYNIIPKNYDEVYSEFRKTKVYESNPISYSTFYNYARKFWGDRKISYILIDELKRIDADD